MKFFGKNSNGVKDNRSLTAPGSVLLTAIAFLMLLGCSNSSQNAGSPSGSDKTEPTEGNWVPGQNPVPPIEQPASEGKTGGESEDFEVPPGHVFPWTSWAIGALVRGLATEGDDIWIGTTNGLIRFHKPDESYKVFTTQDGLMNNIIVSILVDPKGNKWIGTYGGGLHKFDGETWEVFTPYGRGTTDYGSQWASYTPGKGLGDLWVYASLIDRKGILWVATWKGVSRFDGTDFQTFSTGEGLVDEWVYTLSEDQEGTLWLGTEGGVNRFDGREWEVWTHQDGLGAPEEKIKKEIGGTAAQLPQGHHLQQGKEASGYNPNYIVSSAVDLQGVKWFGTWGSGLSRFDGNTWKNYTTEEGLAGNTVNALAVDPEGILWIGTDNGVSRFDGKDFRTFRTRDGLLSNSVFSIAIEKNGTKWFGAYGGVTRYTGE